MQHSVLPTGRRVSLAGVLPVAQPTAGRHRAAVVTWRRVVVVASALLAGMAVAFHLGWLPLGHTKNAVSQDDVTVAAQPGSAADVWIRANLPAEPRVLADGFSPPAGYRSVSLGSAGGNWVNYSYLLTTTISEPPANTALGAVWRSSTPVAIFDDVEVRLILPTTSPEQILRDRENDRTDRIRAGAALLDNAQLMSSRPAKTILSSGGLDLRAATTLSGIVGQIPVTLDKVDVVPAETAAGLAARSITIYSSDPAAVTQALAGMSTAFAPDHFTLGENGAINLHWPLGITPVPTLS